MSLTPSPIFVNESWEIKDLNTIKILVDSIYPEDEFIHEREQIVAFLATVSHSLQSSDIALLTIQEYLKQRVASEPLISSMTGKLLARLTQHINEMLENRSAYVAEKRVNPSAVFWPDPTFKKAPRSLFDELPWANKYGLINKNTAIGSAGSCFAAEIAKRLQLSGFNYVVKEKTWCDPEGLPRASAGWGTIFNVPAMRQLVERSFGLVDTPPLIWYQEKENGQKVYCDPFREDIIFNSVEEFANSYYPHREAARKALMEVEYFVMTLGLNEVWYLKSDGSVFSRCPWSTSASLVTHKVLSVEDNVNELERLLKVWRNFNPKLKLIVTVSPVPLHATFRGNEHHVITANCHSKSTLRVAAEEFVKRNKDVFYFPSYETVMYCCANPWEPDQRHVSHATVDKVMRLFQKMFLEEGSALSESTFSKSSTLSA